MKTNYEGNILTINTEIPVELAKANENKLVLRDEKGNETFMVMANAKTASLSSNGIACNAVVKGKLVCVIIETPGTTSAKVKAMYGDALVKATAAIPAILTASADRAAAIDAIVTVVPPTE